MNNHSININITNVDASPTFLDWQQRGQTIQASRIGGSYGLAVNSTGTVIAAKIEDTNNSGSAVAIYEYSNNTWSQKGSDIGNIDGLDDNTGFSLSLSDDGNTIAIGEPGGYTNYTGRVRIYQYSNNAWILQTPNILGEAESDWCGYNVSLNNDGSIVAVSAPYNDGNGLNAGHVRVYERSGSSWVKLGADIDGGGMNDNSGTSVSLNSTGLIVAVGAPIAVTSNPSTEPGYVKVFSYNGSNWVQVGADIQGTTAGDLFGLVTSISNDGTKLAVGTYRANQSTGYVKIFEYLNGAWSQIGSTLNGTDTGTYTGQSVSLNGDGSRVAIGAPSGFFNIEDSGNVRVYEYSDNVNDWVQIGLDLTSDAGTNFGSNVRLSDGGNIMVASAPHGATVSENAYVKVYQFNKPVIKCNLTSDKTIVSEGQSFIITLDTANIVNGTTVPYTITGIQPGDISENLTGSFTVNNNTATATFNVAADSLTEGTQIFTLALDNNKDAIRIIINDTSVLVYSLNSSLNAVNEGQAFTVTLNTVAITNGTVIPYTITGIQPGDISENLTGSFTVNNNTATATFNVSEDLSTEGTQIFTLALDSAAATLSIVINDTSVTPPGQPTYNLSSNSMIVNEGQSFTVTLVTTNVTDNTLIPYTITGIGSSDISENLTGNFTVNNNIATATFNVAADTLTEGTETFTLTLDNGASVINIVVNDVSLSPGDSPQPYTYITPEFESMF